MNTPHHIVYYYKLNRYIPTYYYIVQGELLYIYRKRFSRSREKRKYVYIPT